MDLLKKCEQVLENNWKSNFTIPSPRLYPFQWNWDSGFIAIGNLYLNPERSLIEMETLFSGQWENGFLPHILFHNAEKHTSYFPSADYWNSKVSSLAPNNIKTSGITQPPVHGFILELLFNHGFEKNRLVKLFDQIVKYHKHLYESREYKDSGLIPIWHNWESGMDNSVWWDDALEKIDEAKVDHIQLFRKDVKEVKESEKTRPKDLDYKRYLYLVHILRYYNYESIPENYPFQILDPVFNTILLESSASLIRIGKKINRKIDFIQFKLEKGLSSFSKYLWNDEDTLYYPFDLISQNQIRKHCSGSYIPIFGSIPSRDRLEKLLEHLSKFDNLNLVPSCFPDQKGFEEKNYWRGPVWINMNWMIWKGLLRYGFDEVAEIIRSNSLELINKFGVYEYFNPNEVTESTVGLGGEDFSWTAALIIDMLRSKRI